MALHSCSPRTASLELESKREDSLILMVVTEHVGFVGLWSRAQMEANAASVLAPLTVVLPSFISAGGTGFWIGPDGTTRGNQ